MWRVFLVNEVSWHICDTSWMQSRSNWRVKLLNNAPLLSSQASDLSFMMVMTTNLGESLTFVHPKWKSPRVTFRIRHLDGPTKTIGKRDHLIEQLWRSLLCIIILYEQCYRSYASVISCNGERRSRQSGKGSKAVVGLRKSQQNVERPAPLCLVGMPAPDIFVSKQTPSPKHCPPPCPSSIIPET